MLTLRKLNRSLVQIYGKDAEAFLQGLITIDIKGKDVGYSCLLDAKGRYNFDFFIIRKEDYFLIDVHKTQAERLIKVLHSYKLISKVFVELVDDFSVVISENYTSTNAITTFLNIQVASFEDPRLPDLPKRYILSNFNADVNEVFYNNLRYQLAIPETELIVGKSIPLECGFEDLNAISFNKGCYLGQEFTNACKNTLFIRKRIVSAKIENIADEEIIILDKIMHNSEEVGTILGKNNHNLLVLLNMEYAKKPINYKGYVIDVSIPKWIQYNYS